MRFVRALEVFEIAAAGDDARQIRQSGELVAQPRDAVGDQPAFGPRDVEELLDVWIFGEELGERARVREQRHLGAERQKKALDVPIALEPRQIEAVVVFVEAADLIERKRGVDEARPRVEKQRFIVRREDAAAGERRAPRLEQRAHAEQLAVELAPTL